MEGDAGASAASGLAPSDTILESAVARLACFARAQRGLRRSLLAFIAGGLSMLAMAPAHLFPVLLVTLPVMVWIVEGAITEGGRKTGWLKAAFAGWWFGFGYHLIGLYWIGWAFMVEADVFAWLLPFAVTLLPAGLALFHAAALGFAADAGLLTGAPLRQSAGLAVALAGSEWLRGHILTGFPWNILGYALTWPLALMQSASLIGIYGLTLLAVFILAAPALMLASPGARSERWRTRGWAAAICVGPLALFGAWGAVRLAVPPPADIPDVKLRLVQPSIPQNQKWRADKQREFFDRHLALSLTAPGGQRDDLAGITHLIWSEASMPFMPLSNPTAMAEIAALLPHGTQLLAGLLRFDPPNPPPGTQRRAYNSLAVIDDEGRPVAIYDKIHLVPFGEYLPFQRVLEAIGLEQLSRMRGGFTPGPRPRPLVTAAGLPPLSILICYEAIFPAAVVQGAARPGALINITNDGWFGATAGPHQHFHQSRLRAVEEGAPLVRISNNGISAVFDPFGRVRSSLALNVAGTIDSGLPGALPPPLYARFGDLPFALAWLALLLWITVGRTKVPRT